MLRLILAALIVSVLAGCQPQKPAPHILDNARRSTNIEDVRPNPNILYGDEVFVYARRGMGGQFTDRATYGFAAEARKRCGIRFNVESGATTMVYSEWLFNPTHRAHRARLVVFLGTSLGGLRATENAIRWSKEVPNARARLLLVDTVPWTPAIPKYIGADHVVWRNTIPGQLGGGRPRGTINDTQHDRPAFQTHGYRIHNAQTRKEVVAEICRGITHPRERKRK